MNDKQSRATTPSPLPPKPRQVFFAQAEDRLRFFASLDQFTRAIQGPNDKEEKNENTQAVRLAYAPKNRYRFGNTVAP